MVTLRLMVRMVQMVRMVEMRRWMISTCNRRKNKTGARVKKKEGREEEEGGRIIERKKKRKKENKYSFYSFFLSSSSIDQNHIFGAKVLIFSIGVTFVDIFLIHTLDPIIQKYIVYRIYTLFKGNKVFFQQALHGRLYRTCGLKTISLHKSRGSNAFSRTVFR